MKTARTLARGDRRLGRLKPMEIRTAWPLSCGDLDFGQSSAWREGLETKFMKAPVPRGGAVEVWRDPPLEKGRANCRNQPRRWRESAMYSAMKPDPCVSASDRARLDTSTTGGNSTTMAVADP